MDTLCIGRFAIGHSWYSGRNGRYNAAGPTIWPAFKFAMAHLKFINNEVRRYKYLRLILWFVIIKISIYYAGKKRLYFTHYRRFL